MALKSHIVSLHSESGPETCQTCGKLFPHSISLRNHIIFGHPELSNIECDVCEQKFFSEKEMKRHKFYQHSDEGARCAICINVKFKLNSNLKQHYMNKHNLTVSKKYPYIWNDIDNRLIVSILWANVFIHLLVKKNLKKSFYQC